MSKFKQRIDEHSSINPSGFTGYIIRNSSVIIDKSYVEKCTSLANVFDNSNVLLKDCGSPVPDVETYSTQYLKLKSKIGNENEKRKLPFWIHYQLKKNDNENFAAAAQGQLKIGIILRSDFQDELYSKVLEIRKNILASKDIDRKSVV